MQKTAIMNVSNGIYFCLGNTILFDLKDLISKETKEKLQKLCLDLRELKQHILECVYTKQINDKAKVLEEIMRVPFESLKINDVYKYAERSFDYIRKYGIVKFITYASQNSISINYEFAYVYKSYFTIETPSGPIRINFPKNETNELIVDFARNLSTATISYERQQLTITLKKRAASMYKPKKIENDQEE